MTTTPNANAEPTVVRRYNAAGLRTLQALERMLNRHADELMQIDCEDAEAAEAVVYAVQAVETALQRCRETRANMRTDG